MKAIDKYMESEKVKVVETYCPFCFPWLREGIAEPHPDPETCNGKQCSRCWDMEWTENYQEESNGTD